jgi:hypothetical protein
MIWTLLSEHAVSQLLQGNEPNWDLLDEVPICTAIEPLLAIERAKKDPSAESSEYCEKWASLSEIVTLLPLDSACLSEALFDRSDENQIRVLWRDSVSVSQPHRRVQRLILRYNYADPTFYAEMEEYYGGE